MTRRHEVMALTALVLGGVLMAASGCGEGAAATQPSQQAPSAAARTAPDWTRVGMTRVMALYLKPGRPAAIEFEVSSPQLKVSVLTEKPLTGHVLFLRSPGPAGSGEDTLTVVPMRTWTRSIAGTVGYMFTAKSIKPGSYRLGLKGDGEVLTVDVRQR